MRGTERRFLTGIGRERILHNRKNLITARSEMILKGFRPAILFSIDTQRLIDTIRLPVLLINRRCTFGLRNYINRQEWFCLVLILMPGA